MDGIIRIKTPKEIKEKYKESKKVLDRLGLEISAYKIEKSLEDDSVAMVLGIMDHLFVDSKYGKFISKEGFFKEFPEWLDFALLKIVEGRKINSDLDKKDIYASLFEAQDQLFLTVRDEDYDGIITRSRIIQDAEDLVRKNNNCREDAKIKELCSLFVDIGLNNQDPEQLGDFSYDNFVKVKKKVKKL